MNHCNYSSAGNQCGWPPVPVNADVVGIPFRGNTKKVSYKCQNNLVLDPRGPQTSTCDQLTGQWTPLPRCIRPDLSVLENSGIVERFTRIRQNNDEFILQNRSWMSPSNPLPGQSPQFPVWIYPRHTVQANAEVVNRSSFSVISIISLVVCSFNYFNWVTR